MESRVKLLGHPLHQRLVVFPLGLLGSAAVFDFIHVFDRTPIWALTAYYMIGAGLLTGMLAATLGALDWLRIPEGTRARRVGAVHGAGNALMLILFGVSWWVRRQYEVGDPPMAAVLLSWLGFGISLVTGWLGSELVNRLGVGVHRGANLNAPNSLRDFGILPGEPHVTELGNPPQSERERIGPPAHDEPIDEAMVDRHRDDTHRGAA